MSDHNERYYEVTRDNDIAKVTLRGDLDGGFVKFHVTDAFFDWGGIPPELGKTYEVYRPGEGELVRFKEPFGPQMIRAVLLAFLAGDDEEIDKTLHTALEVFRQTGARND